MAPRIYFCFHYDDIETIRANVFRNRDITKEWGETGLFDASIWEDAKLQGVGAVRNLIDHSLENTSVTCVLIGTETWNRRWVRYEILKSYDRGNKLLGIHLDGVKDKSQQVLAQTENPFDYLGFMISKDGETLTYYERNGAEWKPFADLQPKTANFESNRRGKGYKLSDWVPCYSWSAGNGARNFATWVDSAK